MADTHAGLRQYSGDESGNVAIGGLGIKHFNTANTSGSVNTGDGNFVAIKVLGNSTSFTDKAVVYFDAHQGDSISSANRITMFQGDILWGAFKKIYIYSIDSGVDILIYNGN